MSHKIYTDSIHDAIGNDPVLDQFDVSYVASFYGSMQDDYVTGTILTEVVGRQSARTRSKFFVTGSRGRAFSKSAAPSSFASSGSIAYRIIQLYDSSECYFDSYSNVTGLMTGSMNAKSIFRRDRFGQSSDMLEQRQYTKFINVGTSPFDNDAISNTTGRNNPALGPAVANVKFVKRKYVRDDRGIGYIFNEVVQPAQTTSQNLSTEITSSLPFFDDQSRDRGDYPTSL